MSSETSTIEPPSPSAAARPPSPSSSQASGKEEEVVDIRAASQGLLRRMAGIEPRKYPRMTPQPRPDGGEYVYRKTAKCRKMVDDQDRMVYNLGRVYNELDSLDREVNRMKEDMRQQRLQRRTYVPRDASAFVMQYPDEYSLQDYLPKEQYSNKYNPPFF